MAKWLRPRVRGLLESANWPCVGAQEKMGPTSWFGRHVNELLNSKNVGVNFDPIQGNTYTLAASLKALV